MPPQGEPVCRYCDLKASENPDTVATAEANEMTPAELARDDGTYNPHINMYACTPCYIKIGMPSSPSGWQVPGDIGDIVGPLDINDMVDPADEWDEWDEW